MTDAPKIVRDFLAKAGRKGGLAKGARKARTSEQARKAAKARWEKHKKVKQST
jgi:hypothetical protein